MDDTYSTPGIYDRITGGGTLPDWYGEVPDFHDAHLNSLSLRSDRPSSIEIAFWRLGQSEFGSTVLTPADERTITFHLDGLVDVNLDHFGSQNVLYTLALRDAVDRPERAAWQDSLGLQDVEIILHASVGAKGFLRCRKVWIELGQSRIHS